MREAAERQADAWYISPQELLRRPPKTGIAVDPENPAEIDDALSVAFDRDTGLYQIEIHIADAGVIGADSALVRYARQKGWSTYFDRPIGGRRCDPMLPLSISKYGLSLNVDHYGLGAPAVTVGFTFDPVLRRVHDLDIYKSRLVGCESITYGQLAFRHSLGDSQARRLVTVARLLNQDTDSPADFSPDSFAENSVGEYMIMANRLIAHEMQKHGIPWLYRYHHTKMPVSLRDIDVTTYSEAQRDLLDAIGLAQYSITPLRHEGLNLLPYTHFTSPLRRFPDLVNGLMLHALLTGTEAPFTVSDLEQIADELSQKTIEKIGVFATSQAA